MGTNVQLKERARLFNVVIPEGAINMNPNLWKNYLTRVDPKTIGSFLDAFTPEQLDAVGVGEESVNHLRVIGGTR